MAQVASELNVRGWVRNLADGSVEAYIEGEKGAVGKAIDWARRGPPRARVDRVEVSPAKVRNFRGFRIEG